MLSSYVGQRDTLTSLTAAIEASRATGRPLPHALFLGKPGIGKTTLAKAVADELGLPSIVINCASVTEKTQIADAAMQLSGGGHLILDETHALDRRQSEALFTLLDNGTVTGLRNVPGRAWEYQWIEKQEDMPPGTPAYFLGAGLYQVPVTVMTKETEAVDVPVDGITVIGCTTDEAMMPPALLSRLSRLMVRLRPYSEVELGTIATLYAEDALECSIDGEAAILIASRSRQSPRRVKQLTERASDYAVLRDGVITVQDAEAALGAAGVDAIGLEEPHRSMLRILVESGGLSRTSLAQRMGLPPRNMQLYWSDLMEAGMVMIDTRHRATDAGRMVVA